MNILFLMADEFRYDIAGFMGNHVAQTPHIDRLAKDAVIFDHAYSPSPVCIPARQCMATGRYPQRAGCLNFGEDIEPNSPTFARWFSEHGYYTVACGKLHHRGPDQMQGWLHRIGAETAVHWPEAYRDRSAIGRGKWRGAEELQTAGPGLSPLSLHDDLSVQGACDLVKMHFGGMYRIPVETPLLLMVSLQQPHFPFRTDKELIDKYLDRVPIFTDQPPAVHPGFDRNRFGPDDGITDDDIRRATAAYYAMVEKTDVRFGRVLAALEEAGQNIDDWLVVFTADHGEMLGEHGVWEKRRFYEGSVRIPMFFRHPSLPARRVTDPANLVDLYPTLSRLAGLPAPSEVDGRDLFTPAESPATFSQLGSDQFMVRAGDHKLIQFGDGSQVLFDLAADPHELANVIDAPEQQAALAGLRDRLAGFLATQSRS